MNDYIKARIRYSTQQLNKVNTYLGSEHAKRKGNKDNYKRALELRNRVEKYLEELNS